MGNSFLSSTCSVSLELLWYIGGSPPVLRNRGPMSSVSRMLLVTLSLALMSCQAQNKCHRWHQDDIFDSDSVIVARVVSRSRSHQGHYSATFLIENILINK